MTTPQVSSQGFAWGLFYRTMHQITFARSRLSHPNSTFRSETLYSIGCLLEERLLLAQGTQLGIFPLDQVAEWLSNNDEDFVSLPLDEFGEDERRIPNFVTADELLAAPEDHPYGFLAFQSTLSSRQHESDLSEFHSALLFDSDAAWSRWYESAQNSVHALRDLSAADASLMARLEDIFGHVMSCTDLLDSRAGRALGVSDPWGMADGKEQFKLSGTRGERDLWKAAALPPKTVADAYSRFMHSTYEADASDENRHSDLNVLENNGLVRLFFERCSNAGGVICSGKQ